MEDVTVAHAGLVADRAGIAANRSTGAPALSAATTVS
jgi:hypothetical protein